MDEYRDRYDLHGQHHPHHHGQHPEHHEPPHHPPTDGAGPAFGLLGDGLLGEHLPLILLIVGAVLVYLLFLRDGGIGGMLGGILG